LPESKRKGAVKYGGKKKEEQGTGGVFVSQQKRKAKSGEEQRAFSAKLREGWATKPVGTKAKAHKEKVATLQGEGT